jgi:phosphorylase kinase alpha/beta subunit
MPTLLQIPYTKVRRVFSGARRALDARVHAGLELLRKPNGVFIAASGDDYNACWIRDQLYATLTYFYTGETRKFIEGVRVVFDILGRSQEKIERAICHMPQHGGDYIHAKYHAETFDEVTNDWGHHQIDAIGLFLFMVGLGERHGMRIVRSAQDREVLQLLVSYLAAVRYFEHPDNGMWEEGCELHASSIGAAVAGLRIIKEAGLAVVPNSLIRAGEQILFTILPNECFNRDVDMAQLSLMWPYELLSRDMEDVILARVKEKLVQSKGLNRYWGDNYYRSANGVSGEWTMGFFWLSIIYAKRGEYVEAWYWYNRGMETMTPEGYLPELYQNGNPNDHTPLAWSHALALIAETKLL